MYSVHAIRIDSTLLRGNAPGDPHERELLVLAPPDVSEPLPVIWMFPGFSGSQGGFLANDPWKEGLVERVTRLVEEGAMPPVLVALPDVFTRFGGSQGLDSTATGPYERHVWEELRPALEANFRVSAHGVCGHSSGGYIALVYAMRHPEIVRAAACHAGDMLFEYSYLPDFPKAAGRLRQDGGVAKFLASFDDAEKKLDGRFLTTMNIVAMAACYSPDPSAEGGLALPFDLDTCELRADVWARWLAHDPVRLVDTPSARAALAGLSCLFIDCGSRDEYQLQWGARALARRLRTFGISHFYEEFDDGHTGTSYRFDRSLPALARSLAGS